MTIPGPALFVSAYARRVRATRCNCSGWPHQWSCPWSLHYRERPGNTEEGEA